MASRQTSEELSLALSFAFSSGHWDKGELQEMLSVEQIQKPLPQALTGTWALSPAPRPSSAESFTIVYSEEILGKEKPHPVFTEQVMEVCRNNLPKVT